MGNDLVRCPHCFVVSEARYIVRRGSSFLDRHTCKNCTAQIVNAHGVLRGYSHSRNTKEREVKKADLIEVSCSRFRHPYMFECMNVD